MSGSKCRFCNSIMSADLAGGRKAPQGNLLVGFHFGCEYGAVRWSVYFLLSEYNENYTVFSIRNEAFAFSNSYLIISCQV